MNPGPDVARIRFAITDLRQNRPVLSDITTDGPIGLGKDNVKKTDCNLVVRNGCNGG